MTITALGGLAGDTRKGGENERGVSGGEDVFVYVQRSCSGETWLVCWAMRRQWATIVN